MFFIFSNYGFVESQKNKSSETHKLLPMEGHWFPKTSYSQLRYQVYFGSYIGYVTFKAYVKVQSGADTISRYLRFYYDGGRVAERIIYSGTTEFTFDFNVWWGGTHTLTAEIYWGAYKDYGWKLDMKQFKLYYECVFVEVNYMADANHNHKPDPNSILNPITEYYRLHGAQNVAFVVDQSVSHTDVMNSSIYNTYYSSYYQHRGQYGWKYMLVGHYDEHSNWWGWAWVNSDGIFIAAQRIADDLWKFLNPFVTYEKAMRVVMMHEVGHTVGIYISDASGEVYCLQPFSVMSTVNTYNTAEDY